MGCRVFSMCSLCLLCFLLSVIAQQCLMEKQDRERKELQWELHAMYKDAQTCVIAFLFDLYQFMYTSGSSLPLVTLKSNLCCMNNNFQSIFSYLHYEIMFMYLACGISTSVQDYQIYQSAFSFQHYTDISQLNDTVKYWGCQSTYSITKSTARTAYRWHQDHFP